MLEISINEETQRKISAILSEVQDADKKILAPAIKRGLAAGKTEAAKGVSQVYAVDKNVFTKYVKTKNTLEAKDGAVIGSIVFSGSVIPLYKFNVSPVTPTYGKKKVKVSVLKSSGQKQLEEAFIAEMQNKDKNHTGIFERKRTWMVKGRAGKKSNKTEHNEQFKELYGPAVPTMIESANVQKSVEERINEIISKRIDHELSQLLKNGG